MRRRLDFLGRKLKVGQTVYLFSADTHGLLCVERRVITLIDEQGVWLNRHRFEGDTDCDFGLDYWKPHLAPAYPPPLIGEP